MFKIHMICKLQKEFGNYSSLCTTSLNLHWFFCLESTIYWATCVHLLYVCWDNSTYTYTYTHYKHLYLVGNQLIASNSFVPMWNLLPKYRHYLIHLFCTNCIFLLNFLFMQWYGTRHAKSKCGWISALHRSFLRNVERKFCFWCKN